MTPATSQPDSQDPPNPQNMPHPATNALGNLDPLNVMRASNDSTVAWDDDIAQDPPNPIATPIPDSPGSHPHATTSPTDNRMDVDESTLAPNAENVGQAASPVQSPPRPMMPGVNVDQAASAVESLSSPTTPMQSSSGSTTTPSQETRSTPESDPSPSPPMTPHSTPKTVDVPPPTKNKDHASNSSAKTTAQKRIHPSKYNSMTKNTRTSQESTATQSRSNPHAT